MQPDIARARQEVTDEAQWNVTVNPQDYQQITQVIRNILQQPTHKTTLTAQEQGEVATLLAELQRKGLVPSQSRADTALERIMEAKLAQWWRNLRFIDIAPVELSLLDQVYACLLRDLLGQLEDWEVHLYCARILESYRQLLKRHR